MLKILVFILFFIPAAQAQDSAQAEMDIGATVVASPYTMQPGDAARVCRELNMPCQYVFTDSNAESDILVFTSGGN